MLLFRQIAAVCPGVGGEFLFIKALGDIQDALGRHAESGGSEFLQGREAMRQGGGSGFLFPQRFQNRSFLAVDRFQNGGNLSKVHKTPGAVQSVLRVGRHEGDGTFSVGVDDACPQHKIIRGLEMGDLPVAGHNQRQRGRLDSAEGKPVMVRARVAFMPTSQSAIILARAASRKGALAALSVMLPRAMLTERSSREGNQIRKTGPR